MIGAAANEWPPEGRGRGGASDGRRARGRRAMDARVRGHAHPGGADALRETAGRGAHGGHRGGRGPAARYRGYVPRRAVRHAARRLQPIRAHAHPVPVGRRPPGRRPRARVSAALAGRVQRDGRPAEHAHRPARLPQASAAVSAQPVGGLPVPEHLRSVTRSVAPSPRRNGSPVVVVLFYLYFWILS